MAVKSARPEQKADDAIRLRTIKEQGSKEKPGCLTTQVRINNKVEVASKDGWICLWVAGREVRIGPLSPEQAEKLSEDLGYDAVR